MSEEVKTHQSFGPPRKKVVMDETLQDLESLRLPQMFRSFCKDLVRLGVCTPIFALPEKMDLQRIRHAVQSLSKGSDLYFSASRVATKIYALANARTALLLEGYQAFLDHARRIASNPHKGYMELASDSGFQELRRIAETNLRLHPKAKKFMELAGLVVERKQTCVTFVESESTALLLLEMLKKKGYTQSEIVLEGGSDHVAATTSQHISNTVVRLKSRDLQFVIASSKLQGQFLPEMADRYIQYSIPDRYEASKVLVERCEKGWVKVIYHLALDHDLEMMRYWESYYHGQFPNNPRRRETPAQIAQVTPPAPSSPPRKAKYRGKGHPDDGQLNLF